MNQLRRQPAEVDLLEAPLPHARWIRSPRRPGRDQQPRAEETLLLENCAFAEVYDRTTAKLKFPHDWLELRSYEPCTECGARTGCNQTFLH